ncbi:MAG: RcnB family protein [Xanthobacteraceae bacterium]
MLRAFAIAASFALVLPTLALAQHDPHHPPQRRVVHPVHPVHPFVRRGPMVHHGPVVVHRGPVGPHGPLLWRGHSIHRVHFAHPWVYPPGWGYRRWAVGAVLPALFLAPAYYYSGWANLGLTAPPPGYQWVQYGPDLLLVNVSTGQVADTVYGVFY